MPSRKLCSLDNLTFCLKNGPCKVPNVLYNFYKAIMAAGCERGPIVHSDEGEIFCVSLLSGKQTQPFEDAI